MPELAENVFQRERPQRRAVCLGPDPSAAGILGAPREGEARPDAVFAFSGTGTVVLAGGNLAIRSLAVPAQVLSARLAELMPLHALSDLNINFEVTCIRDPSPATLSTLPVTFQSRIVPELAVDEAAGDVDARATLSEQLWGTRQYILAKAAREFLGADE